MKQEEYSSGPPPRERESPPDEAFRYTPPLERFAGAAVDVIFLHIILIPLRAPAADLSFAHGSIAPALFFTVVYFVFLFAILLRGGLTPGGLLLKYRVVNRALDSVSWRQGLKRLAPYILIQAIGLWRLQVVLINFEASGETYELVEMQSIIQSHGGLWNYAVLALNSYLFIDLLIVLQSPRYQSLSDIFANSVVVSRSAQVTSPS